MLILDRHRIFPEPPAGFKVYCDPYEFLNSFDLTEPCLVRGDLVPWAERVALAQEVSPVDAECLLSVPEDQQTSFAAMATSPAASLYYQLEQQGLDEPSQSLSHIEARDIIRFIDGKEIPGSAAAALNLLSPETLRAALTAYWQSFTNWPKDARQDTKIAWLVPVDCTAEHWNRAMDSFADLTPAGTREFLRQSHDAQWTHCLSLQALQLFGNEAGRKKTRERLNYLVRHFADDLGLLHLSEDGWQVVFEPATRGLPLTSIYGYAPTSTTRDLLARLQTLGLKSLGHLALIAPRYHPSLQPLGTDFWLKLYRLLNPVDGQTKGN